MNNKNDILSTEELALMHGGFGIEDVTVYAQGIQGVNNCCNITNTGGGTTTTSKPSTTVKDNGTVTK